MMKHLKSLVGPTLVAIFVVTAAQAAMYQWSKVASNNATADPTINYSEGMSPSSVNDSARAAMARTAEWRDDISGALTTTGTGTALVLTSNQGFTTTALMDKAMIAFVPNVTTTGAVTLAVDGLTAKPIRMETGTGGNLGAGVLIKGTPYVVTYFDTAGEFILQGFTGNPYAVPLGSFLFHSSSTVPNSNFVLPYGQAISRTTYATYFAMVGTTFGAGDGVTTFNVPDLRSRVPLPWGAMGGVDPSRVTTSGSGIDGGTVGATGGSQNQTISTAQMPAHTHSIPDPGHTHLQVANAGANQAISSTNRVNNINAAGVFSDYNLVGTGSAATLGLSSSATTGITVTNSTGGGTATTTMPPVLVLPVILRVL